MDADVRQLRVFLVVARELHFSRAADQLHMSQPALSQQIRALERDLGVELFARTSRQVSLTPAGEALLAAAPRAIYELEEAVLEAQRAASGASGRLVVGSVRSGLSSIVPPIMRAFWEAHPEVRLEVYHMDTSAQLRALAERRIDVGIVRSAGPTQSITLERLLTEPLMIAMPTDHAFAALAVVEPAALAGEKFVISPRHLGTDFFDIVVAYCRGLGFSPRINAEGDDVDTQFALVAAGIGISFQPAFYAGVAPEGVTFRPLNGPSPEVSLQLAWRNDRAPATEAFVQAARRVVRER
jgi:DNA-binding transcriptional LysR family regulator